MSNTMSSTNGDNDELAKIEEEIKRLVAKIELSAQCGEKRGGNSDKWFRAHCALQYQLELAWHRQAQLEEKARIEQVRHDAVESGLVVTPNTQLNMGECPLCLSMIPDPHVDEFQTYRRNACCGVACCIDCADQHERAHGKANDARNAAHIRGDMAQFRARHDECESLQRCPFCRKERPSRYEMCYQMEFVHAKVGKAWAQF
jgi:hypothetical protein